MKRSLVDKFNDINMKWLREHETEEVFNKFQEMIYVLADLENEYYKREQELNSKKGKIIELQTKIIIYENMIHAISDEE
jgi:hypothetical protein